MNGPLENAEVAMSSVAFLCCHECPDCCGMVFGLQAGIDQLEHRLQIAIWREALEDREPRHQSGPAL
jgi:hypothetical protein